MKSGVLLATVLLFSGLAGASETSGESEWILEPEKTINSIVFEEKGDIIAARGDAGNQIIYLETNTDIFRCVEIFHQEDEVVRVEEAGCHRLRHHYFS